MGGDIASLFLEICIEEEGAYLTGRSNSDVLSINYYAYVILPLSPNKSIPRIHVSQTF
jgi:hypothetical protein